MVTLAHIASVSTVHIKMHLCNTIVHLDKLAGPHHREVFQTECL